MTYQGDAQGVSTLLHQVPLAEWLGRLPELICILPTVVHKPET
jgi:hypothetical protein